MRYAAATLLLAAVVAGPGPLEAQPGPGESRGGPPAVAEARLAWDYRSEAPGLGAAFRLPVLGARGDLVAGGEAVFRDGLTELQGHVDALAAFGGRSALVAGAGPVVLRSVFVENGPEESRWGWTALVGLRQLPDAERRVGLALELRWVFVDELEPSFLTLGVSLPLFAMPF